MNIYSKKQRWKLILAAFAAIIVFVSLWYTNVLVGKIAKEEQNKAKSWAEAIQRKAELVNYTQELFEKIREEETKKVKIWAMATEEAGKPDLDVDPTLTFEIITSNKTIQTNGEGRITSSTNIPEELTKDSIKMSQLLREMKIKGNFIKINYTKNAFNYMFYGESSVFAELREVLQDQIESFNKDITSNSASAPVIYATETDSVLDFGNLDSVSMAYSSFVSGKIAEMKEANEPLEIHLTENETNYIYYADSPLLVKLKY